MGHSLQDDDQLHFTSQSLSDPWHHVWQFGSSSVGASVDVSGSTVTPHAAHILQFDFHAHLSAHDFWSRAHQDKQFSPKVVVVVVASVRSSVSVVERLLSAHTGLYFL